MVYFFYFSCDFTFFSLPCLFPLCTDLPANSLVWSVGNVQSLNTSINTLTSKKKKSILPLETVTQIEFFSAPHANSFCQEKSLNQVSDSQNTYLQSTRERQLKSQFYTWNQQHVLHTTDHHSANFYTDLGRFCPVPFLPGKARKRLGKNCHEKYCSVYYYYFF